MVKKGEARLLMKDNLLIIFTRNPQLGKVKTRLASTIGNNKALKVYKFLLQHTADITHDLNTDKEVHYSRSINENDIWSRSLYDKKLQLGEDLGARMMHAINQGFKNGYKNICLIGSDIYDLNTSDLERAFELLNDNEVVIGPAQDGGYYLIGLTKMIPSLFQNKKWGSNSVLNDTLAELPKENFILLGERNDIDTIDDLNQFKVLKKLLTNSTN